MNLRALLRETRQSLSEFWAAREERERAMLTAGGFVVVLGLIYALLIDPALSGRTRLDKNLPELRQQVAQLQALAQEAAMYSATAATPVAAMTAEGIKATLEAKGLKAQNVALTGELAKVQLASASFAGTVNWLDEIQKTARLLVVDANIVVLDKPDTVNATVTLRQPRNE
jgi:general secretion pathway protein M